MQHHSPRRNPPPPSPEADCALDLSRTVPFSSADDSSVPGPSTEWTDEKHRLYIHSLEASFVNQLQNSIARRGCFLKTLWGPHSNRATPTDYPVSVHQLMVLQDGKRQKTDPKRDDFSVESTADSLIIQQTPCKKHLTSSGKRSIIESHHQEHTEASRGILNGGETYPLCSARSSLQQFIEVSDQNFVDADQEERSNCREKKMSKRVMTDYPSNDQVVAYQNATKNYASASHLVSSVIHLKDQELGP